MRTHSFQVKGQLMIVSFTATKCFTALTQGPNSRQGRPRSPSKLSPGPTFQHRVVGEYLSQAVPDKPLRTLCRAHTVVCASTEHADPANAAETGSQERSCRRLQDVTASADGIRHTSVQQSSHGPEGPGPQITAVPFP